MDAARRLVERLQRLLEPGRVLSAANEAKVRAAIAALQEVLAQVGADQQVPAAQQEAAIAEARALREVRGHSCGEMLARHLAEQELERRIERLEAGQRSHVERVGRIERHLWPRGRGAWRTASGAERPGQLRNGVQSCKQDVPARWQPIAATAAGHFFHHLCTRVLGRPLPGSAGWSALGVGGATGLPSRAGAFTRWRPSGGTGGGQT